LGRRERGREWEGKVLKTPTPHLCLATQVTEGIWSFKCKVDWPPNQKLIRAQPEVKNTVYFSFFKHGYGLISFWFKANQLGVN